ncbi:hypothetical protein [Leptolyngbya sp. FACHB-261]|uniref:hypothetical protein n=1 Tax=Leptolyngbya sp. FACHB-261 TaxID=2692806 RepID=UPI001682EAC2|nr:hypothetical protein [Leptolyngbya sp. FACHB-261]MBD2103590.1 hypothetical protein [Leptolyngbya sp. FACHB-261]
MPSSNEYRRQVMNDLAGGDVEQLPDNHASAPAENYDNFDDFANRSSREERRGLFGRSFHPDRIPSAQMEPELQQAISRIQPNQRDDVARDFLKHFKQRGLSEKDIERQLGLSTHHASHMSADDVSKLAAFAYRSHPDIFQDVLADQPFLVKFLSNPMVGAALGAIAAKWMGGRR